jgi:hypothetical protein
MFKTNHLSNETGILTKAKYFQRQNSKINIIIVNNIVKVRLQSKIPVVHLSRGIIF